MCTFVIKPTESQHTDDVVPIFCKVSLLVNWAVLFLIPVVRTGKMRHIALPLIIKNNHLYGGSFSIYLFVCMSTNAQIVYDRWPQRILASIDVSTKWLKTTHFNDLLLAVFFFIDRNSLLYKLQSNFDEKKFLRNFPVAWLRRSNPRILNGNLGEWETWCASSAFRVNSFAPKIKVNLKNLSNFWWNSPETKFQKSHRSILTFIRN